MTIGIIGAMEEEVKGLAEKLEGRQEEVRAGRRFLTGRIAGKEVALVCSGIGKVNAAVAASILAEHFHAGCILNTGIAGGIAPEVKLGDIVLSTDCLEHDFDVTAFGYEKGVIPRMKTSTFPADQKLLELAKSCEEELDSGVTVHTGRVVSGDLFVASREKKEELYRDFHGSCCEMEGAAIAHTAYLYGLPYLVIRAISDQADMKAVENYPAFTEQAIRNFLALTLRMLEAL
ncbi:5'-methylthioadenosine/adenosylhomocysteine nucleosidase [Stomatobaculum longum]|jgi:MTA/SAH nucleosidase|uniref:5'-methylthioadenosine/adenosylhomocysteine nucleosidase n=1 Tax=Stomatobaculum longum TaxID=796942 RepID=UPI0028E77982|nr:5'-methylthioadenosine/adenosylhomocysteine nucleosidase [Stomatobaculum longum]